MLFNSASVFFIAYFSTYVCFFSLMLPLVNKDVYIKTKFFGLYFAAESIGVSSTTFT